jgi:hypothetical protein
LRAVAVALCLMGIAGCTVGREIPAVSAGVGSAGGGVVTPSGSYNITVSGTSAGLVRSVGLMLVVQ